MVRRVTAVRRAAVARRRLRSVIWVGGLLALAVGLLLALEEAWIGVAAAVLAGAVLMWFAGAWVLPRTRDGYVRRLMRVWNAWANHGHWVHGQVSRRQGKFADCIAALSPPPECAAEHERLVSLAAEVDRLRSDGSIPFPERVRQVALRQQAARQAKDEAVRRAAGGPYAVALDRLFEERRSEYVRTAAISERAISEAEQ
jgi:hypothetical protein